MNKHLIVILISALGINTANGQSVKDLDFLIGKWEISEIVYPGTDKEYIEKGTRECRYVLNETYIQCTSQGERHGKKRVYQSNINYDKAAKLFVMKTIFSDYDFKGSYEMHLDMENKALHIIPEQEKGETNFYRSRISYSNPNLLIWEGWTSEFNESPSWKKLYTEEARRKR